MSWIWRLIAFMAAIPAGVVLSMFVPIYSQPFGGCLSISLFIANPHCSYWPEALSGALLVLPVSLLIRSSRQLGVLSLLVCLLALFGGLEGMRIGTHLQPITWYWALSNLVWQLPGTLASLLVLAAGFGFYSYRRITKRSSGLPGSSSL